LSVLKPDIFFDDQKTHIEDAAKHTMSAHVVFGVRNERVFGQDKELAR
jgi:hypothetical protein